MITITFNMSCGGVGIESSPVSSLPHGSLGVY